YDPIMCLILQGRKVTTVGDRTFSASAGDCIIVSHDLPVVARITDATESSPYLAMVAKLDLSELRSLYDEVGDAEHAADQPSAYAVGPADSAVLDVMTRYATLDDAASCRVLAPLIRRELHYRLLTTHNGAMLRELLRRDSHASGITRAIRIIRERFRESLEVPELARSVGMSTSAFHKHFKEVTTTTPLQYQKSLRLTEARRLLWTGSHSVSSAAFAVGYESPTQFSREYSRKFGSAPKEVLKRGVAQATAP
ncbi:MAG: AraC family transcriptional regulator, partial [Myxococcota bacterium]